MLVKLLVVGDVVGDVVGVGGIGRGEMNPSI